MIQEGGGGSTLTMPKDRLGALRAVSNFVYFLSSYPFQVNTCRMSTSQEHQLRVIRSHEI